MPATIVSDPIRVLLDSFDHLHPDKECQVWFDPSIDPSQFEEFEGDEGAKLYGFTSLCGCDKACTPSVVVDAKQPYIGLLDTLCHELAHVATMHVVDKHGPEWEAVYAALHIEYSRRMNDTQMSTVLAAADIEADGAMTVRIVTPESEQVVEGEFIPPVVTDSDRHAQKVEAVLARFNFSSLEGFMQDVGWRWLGADGKSCTPDSQKLYNAARELLDQLRPERTLRCSSGGFTAVKDGGVYRLYFALEEADTIGVASERAEVVS